MSAALKIFIIYAREDESFKISLLRAFIPLANSGKIEVFYDTLIEPGDRWEDVILENLLTAHIILPLVSNDFFASKYINEIEFKKAIDRHNKGEAVIIPVILKPCGWKYDPIIRTLQVLPKDGTPVVTWAYHEEAWEQILDAVYEETEKVEEKNRLEAKRFFDLGYNKTDLREKIKHFSKAIKLDPDNAIAYFNRGWVKNELGKYSEAIKDFDQAKRLNLNAPEVYICCGFAKNELNQYEEAIKDLDQAILFNPNNATAYLNRGNSKGGLGQHAEAIKDYDRAIRLDPEDALAYYYRGFTKSELGQYVEAIKDYDQAIRLDPKNALAYNNRGVAKENLGFLEEAKKDYQKARSIDPNHEFAKTT